MFVNPRFFEPVAIPCGSLIRGHDYTVVPVPVKAGNPALPAGYGACGERGRIHVEDPPLEGRSRFTLRTNPHFASSKGAHRGTRSRR